MKANRILYIDEEKDQLDMNLMALRRILGGEFIFEGMEPCSTIAEMIEEINNRTDLGALLLDERLSEKGTAHYLGIELASKLRLLQPKLPIFILTNYAYATDEFGPSAASVENILDKAKLNEEIDILTSRIKRHIYTYNDILLIQDGRLAELIRSSLERDLSEEERIELEGLDLLRMAPVVLSETNNNAALDLQIGKLQTLLNEAKEMIERGKNHG